MLKRDELSNPNSCLNKAADDEPIFVLRAKDPCAPRRLRDWASDRIEKGLNKPDDPKVLGAYRAADEMDDWQHANPYKIKKAEFDIKLNERQVTLLLDLLRAPLAGPASPRGSGINERRAIAYQIEAQLGLPADEKLGS